MNIDYAKVAEELGTQTGMRFAEAHGSDAGECWIDLRPAGHSTSASFRIRATIGWRHIEIEFLPGAFSGELLRTMSKAPVESKQLFSNLLLHCQTDGATVELLIGVARFAPDNEALWETDWSNVVFNMRIGQLDLSDDNASSVQALVLKWMGRMAAAVISLMPVAIPSEDEAGFSEGMSASVELTRYERDPRNRIAALSIHGHSCAACSVVMSDVYGQVAQNFIEVHHTTPVSELGESYVIDPRTDLIPLCPNCHSIIHRRNPPFTLAELRTMLKQHTEVPLKRSES